MSNQIALKASTFAEMLQKTGLVKNAADQVIDHKNVLDQTNIGKDMATEIKNNVPGVSAATPAAANTSTGTLDTPPNCQDLNRAPDKALSSTGSPVNVSTPTGESTTLPKTASEYRTTLAGILNQIKKQASATQTKQAAASSNITTGSTVMTKFASLTDKSTQAEWTDAQNTFIKLAATNPIFDVCRKQIMMTKMAEDVQELAAAEGISPEEAAQLMNEAATKDPSLIEDTANEADGAAVADLANAESVANELMGGVQQLADNASSVTGVEVTPEDIMDAIDEVEAQAQAQGVPPEALIQAAVDQLQASGDTEVTPEDEAQAQQLMEEAAAKGVSPDELMQAAIGELDNGGGEDAAAKAECAEDPEKCAKKTASIQPNLANSMRVQYVRDWLHSK